MCSISGSTLSLHGAGTCVIDANQAGNANYNAAPQVQQSFTVAKGNQTITLHLDEPVAGDGRWRHLHRDGDGDLGPGGDLHARRHEHRCARLGRRRGQLHGVGTCVIDANQAGNANYNAAPQVQQSFTVDKGNQTISFTSTAPAQRRGRRRDLHRDGHGHLGPGGDFTLDGSEHRLHL